MRKTYVTRPGASIPRRTARAADSSPFRRTRIFQSLVAGGMVMSAMPVAAAEPAEELSPSPATAEQPGATPNITAAAEAQSAAPAASTSARLKPPAVDGVNGKVDAMGGSIGGKSMYGARGSLSIPLSGQFGAQLDAAAGELDHHGFRMVAGHAFWRDPSEGLIGLLVSHAHWDRVGGMDLNHVAAEGELYRGPITFRAVAGLEAGNSGSRAIGGGFVREFDFKTRFFGNVGVAYYPQDNLKVSARVSRIAGRNALIVGGEWAVPLQGGMSASLFAEGAAGENRFDGIFVGVKLYFAKAGKTLIRRHREDDPDFFIDPLYAFVASVRKVFAGLAASPPPPPPPPDDGGDAGEGGE